MITCKHFGYCGGCRFLDREYSLQLEEKDERCRELLQDSGVKANLQEIIPSPQPLYYRNKMEFTFYHDEGDLVRSEEHTSELQSH